MNFKQPIEYYAKISAVTSQMLAAAQDGDWDLLCELEVDCTHFVDALKQIDNGPQTFETMSNKKINYIKNILENDRQIRALVNPWMDKLNGLMNHRQTERKLTQAYQP